MVARREVPPAQLVRYDDWRQVELPSLAEFRPESPVSVVAPYYAQREEPGRTLAARWPDLLAAVRSEAE